MLGEFDGAEHIGRLVDQFAGQQRAFDGGAAVGDGLVGGGFVGDVEGDGEHFWLGVVLLGALVAVEAVVAEAEAGDHFCEAGGVGVGAVDDHGGLFDPRTDQLAAERTATVGPGGGRHGLAVGRLAAAEHQQPVGLDAVGREDIEHLALLALEAGGLGDLGPIEPGRRPDRRPGTLGLTAVGAVDDQRAGGFDRQGRGLDLELMGHGGNLVGRNEQSGRRSQK